MEDQKFIVCNKEDISSFANFQEFRQEHIHIKNKIDFENFKLFGFVEIKFKCLISEENKQKKRIILDSKNIVISDVTNLTSGNQLKWHIYKEHVACQALGTPLVIDLDKDIYSLNEDFILRIKFSTTKESDAALWLDANQTHLKKYPYMFTQCEAILARTLLPCQDSPSVKCTVSVELTCASPLTFVFSGQFQIMETHHDSNDVTFHYCQNIPIPTYLIAYVCGDLEFGKISDRCGVYTEKGILEKALFEFADTEKFLKTAEEYLNPYAWGIYNILVLPFAFPYGGMENPCLTFVTPALLAGDRSLTNVIAHEIAHSWTGNLVTNKDWTNFWMNEGFTKFLERKISEIINGEDISNLEAAVGMVNLEHAIQSFGVDHSFTSLNPDLTNIDPDDAFSVVPYEKGYCLLKFLERIIGKENFQTILRDYIQKFSQRSVSYHDYIKIFNDNLERMYSQEECENIKQSIDWEKWIFSPGYIFEKIDLTTKWIDLSNEMAELFLKGDSNLINENEVEKFKLWHTNVKIVFLSYLEKNQSRITAEIYENLRDKLGLHNNYNVEVSFSWYQICLDLKKDDILDIVKKFLLGNGRMKYIKPLYFKFYAYSKEEALKFFKENKHIYHTVASRLIQRKFDEFESLQN